MGADGKYSLRERLRWGAGENERVEGPPLMARVGVYLFFSGATVGLVSLALPGGSERSETGLLATVLVAYAFGVFELLVFDRLPLWAFHALTAAGTGLVSSALYFGGESSNFYGLFYFWVALYAAYFFSFRETGLHLALIAAAYGVMLAVADRGAIAPIAWLLTVATLAVITALVILLKTRLEKLLAEQSEQVERLRELDRLKDEFVATVSHELRTPLAAVYGAALTVGARTLDDEKRGELLSIVARESERLARLVDDVLLTSRLDAGRVRSVIESCDARALVRDVVEAARVHAPDDVDLAVAMPDSVPPVLADPENVRLVIGELIENAIKYSPDGGRVEVKIEAENGHVRFTVRDEGLGIPPDEQRRIFEKFYRPAPDLTHGIGGSGLGLYICRELVQRMDGEISLSSRPGEGSTFAVELPADVPADRPLP